MNNKIIKQNRLALDSVITELNGFLNALQRLCGFEYSFGARLVPKRTHLLADLNKQLKPIETIKPISYREVETFLEQYIYQKLNAQAQQIRELDWHLIEYYGLAYTAANPRDKHCLNSLVSDGAWLVQRTKNSNQSENSCFVVDLKTIYIVTIIQIYHANTPTV